MPDVSNFGKKIDYGANVPDIENKLNNLIMTNTTSEFNTLATDALNARLS